MLAESKVSRIEIRKAGFEDLPWLVAQLRLFASHYGTKFDLFGEEEYCVHFVAGLIENHVVFLSDCLEFGPTGFIAALKGRHPFNPQIRTLSEMFWWVSEEHRGSRAAALLLQEFISFGKQNADWVTLSLERHSPIKDEALLKRGFILQERGFLMET